MKKAVFLLFYSICCALAISQAQTGFLNSSDAYLGQKPPGNLPEVFAPGLLATRPYFSANRVAFSADGREFYYCHNISWANKDSLKIKYFKYVDGSWKGPFLLNKQYFAPTFSMNDNTLYFGGSRGEIWQSQRTATGWGEPTRYLETMAMYDFVPTNSGTMYAGSGQFIGAEKKPGNFDICTISISGSDSSFNTLGVPINSPGWNGDFFVARDESFIITSSKETPDFESELFISYRKPDKTWTNPKSLGPLINRGLAHRYGQYVTNDNKYLFYCYGHSEKDCAVYWVRFDKLFDSLKHTNFDPYVYDSLKDQQFSINQNFTIPIPPNSFIDDDGSNTLRFTAQMSDGHTLPAWIRFDPKKRVLAGKGTAAGVYRIKVVAKDTQNASAETSFNLTLTN